jgi:hypothetical protein
MGQDPRAGKRSRVIHVASVCKLAEKRKAPKSLGGFLSLNDRGLVYTRIMCCNQMRLSMIACFMGHQLFAS